MSLHAYDSNSLIIQAKSARKQINYYCIECKEIVQLRGGPYRQFHFYHIEPTHCRQSQKGPIHLQLQCYFLKHLPTDDCKLEHPFHSIRRIADVAWLSRKIVFEIQYSPIRAEEVLARNQDYSSEGWQVIWILHDRRFNQFRLSAAEKALRFSPYYYTNMNEQGKGFIYDQFDIIERGFRYCRLPPLIVQVSMQELNHRQSAELLFVVERIKYWRMGLVGDLCTLYESNPKGDYFLKAKKLEKKFYSKKKGIFCVIVKWLQWIVEIYRSVFQFFLEKMCR
jgi:competence protein CoiA